MRKITLKTLATVSNFSLCQAGILEVIQSLCLLSLPLGGKLFWEFSEIGCILATLRDDKSFMFYYLVQHAFLNKMEEWMFMTHIQNVCMLA